MNSSRQSAPLFSVITPVYNRSDTLPRALDSLMDQTLDDWECMIIDDESTDDSRDVARRYAQNDSRFHILENSRSKGACGARNTGILQAHGSYVVFLDSDDMFLPEALKKWSETFQGNPEVDFVYCDVEFRDEEEHLYPHGMQLGMTGHVYAESLRRGYLCPGGTLAIKREVLTQVGMWDEAFPASQDDDLCFKLARNHQVGYVNRVLIRVYGSSSQISRHDNQVAMGWWILWNKYEQDVLSTCGHAVMEKHWRECLSRFIAIGDARHARKACRKAVAAQGRAVKPWTGLRVALKICKANIKRIIKNS